MKVLYGAPMLCAECHLALYLYDDCQGIFGRTVLVHPPNEVCPNSKQIFEVPTLILQAIDPRTA